MLDDEDLSGGDFVRNVKQLIDLLRQIGEVAPQPGHRARSPARPPIALFRGVVAASSAIGQGGGADDLDEGALEAVGSPPGDDDTSATG